MPGSNIPSTATPASSYDNGGWGAPIVATISITQLILLAGLSVWLKNDNLLLLVGGAIIANGTMAAQYYLGSSRGSQMKDKTIADQLPTPPSQPHT